MKLKDFLFRQLMLFFILTTLITVAIMILGLVFDPDAELKYDAMASPLVFAALGVLPGMIMYSPRELTIKQVIFRKIIQLLLIEAEVLTVAFSSPLIHTEQIGTVAALAFSVIIIFAAANFFSYLTDLHTAKQLTSMLTSFQKQNFE